jgi:hypothetical protein
MRRLEPACRLAATLVIAFVFSVGCGYRSQLAGASSEKPVEGQPHQSASTGESLLPLTRIAVLALRNDSPEPWLDRIMSDAIRREFDVRGVFDVVNDPNRADVVVRGRIGQLDTTSKSFSRFVAAVEYGLTVRLDLEVVLLSGDIVRLDSGTLTESDVYLASPDIEVTRTNRLEVLRRLSDVLASRVADSIELLERPISEAAVEEGG